MPKIALFILIQLFSWSILANNEVELVLPEVAEGDKVCSAYLGHFSRNLIGLRAGQDWQEEVVFVRALPYSYCEFAGRVGRLRVLAVGDFYTYSSNHSNTVTDPDQFLESTPEEVVCYARVELPGSGKFLSMTNLPEDYCYAGAEVLFAVGTRLIRGRVEVAYDFHYKIENRDEDLELVDIINDGKLPRRVLLQTGAVEIEI